MTDGTGMRVALIGDVDGIHTRSWINAIAAAGHLVQPIAFYPPASPLPDIATTPLRPRPVTRAPRHEARGRTAGRMPRGLLRLAHAVRYRRAGLRRAVDATRPDIVHAHYVVEHGFYAAFSGLRPLVVTAWGSDILLEPARDPISGLIARWTLRRADAVTSNNAYMAEEAKRLGADTARLYVVTLGADRLFLDAGASSVNLEETARTAPPTILSTRAHEPLYNIGDVIDAYGLVRGHSPEATLVIAHGGSMTDRLQARAAEVGGDIRFVGFVAPAELAELMTRAAVFVSVPTSDGTSVALLQAMAAGAFPVVSDLPSQRELVDGVANGFRVPLHQPARLAEAVERALRDPALRRAAALRNRAYVAAHGLNDVEMQKLAGVYAAAVDHALRRR
jgi:glycosyltransferase involved in cell wall biosynthesis